MKRIKIFFILAFLPLLVYFSSTHHEIEESKTLFASGVYASYHLPAKTIDEHIALVKEWREQKRAEELFTHPLPFKAWKDFLHSITPASSLLTMHHALKQNPSFSSIHHAAPSEDQLLYANLPSHMATVKKTKIIRMAQPICQNGGIWKWMSSPSPSPEFIRFVNSQSGHLYVNLMKRHGIEGRLTQALEGSEKEHSTLYVLTLDKDSSFYTQQSDEGSIDTNLFLDQFTAALSGKQFYFTQKIEKPDFREILATVQQHYFPSHSTLSKQERQDFIELSYLALIDHYVDKITPSTMNISCKQAIDRGPSLAVLWLIHQRAVDDEEAIVYLLAPPLLFHNRPSHTARLLRFQSALDRLSGRS